jgi:hypothetical protein
VYGNGALGVAYGMAELARLTKRNDDTICFPIIDDTDSPAMPFRGIHLYMPGADDVEGFYRLIDMMVLLRYNTLILEVGGGMEYKNHPEINIGWERFCKEIYAFANGPEAFQGSDTYWKDSTHTEIGGGSFLPQHTVRGIVQYAKAYGLNVVPELQMFSHAYYITTVYPEYAERTDDHYPDTVCPLCQDAYQLYFRLAQEVLEVFAPTMVSIGHDEIWTMGFCDKCKEKTGHELLAYEVNRLHEYYEARGVKIAMWCEKLQNVTSYFTGEQFGGVEKDIENAFGRKWHIPATYEAMQKIPKDILLLDWLYGYSWDSQNQAGENGFRQIFGNFHGEWTRGWDRRKASSNLIGGETSSWCRSHEFTLGHDNILGDFWYSSLMLWDKAYDESKYESHHKVMRYELPRLREVLQDRPSLMRSMRPKNATLLYTADCKSCYTLKTSDLPEIPVFAAIKQMLPAQISGAPAGESIIQIPVASKLSRLLIVHSALCNIPQKMSYCHNFKDQSPIIYAVRYVDGETTFIHARFGIEIGNIAMKAGRKLNYRGQTPEDPGGFDTDPKTCSDPPLYILNHQWQNSLIYSAAPFESGENCLYMMEWINPKPDTSVEKIYAVNTANSKEEQGLIFLVVSSM